MRRACFGLVLVSCNAIFGIEPGEPIPAAGGGGGGISVGGAGAAGEGAGAGGSGGASCVDGEPCYSGDPRTLVPTSNCRQGTWQSCETAPTCGGEILPSAEDFAVAGDENCDGLPRGELELGLQIDARVQVSCSVTPDGGLLIAGSAYSISDLDGSPPPELPFLDGTAFVAKFDAAGGFLWHYAFSDPTRNELTSEIPIVLVPDDQGGAVVFLVPRQGASVVGDLVLQGDGIQIVNLSPTGEATLVGYVPVASGTNPVITDVVRTADGGYVAVGTFAQSTLDLSPIGPLGNPDTDPDAVVIKFSSTFIVEAAKRYGGASGIVQSGLAAASRGDELYVAGISSGTLSAGGLGNICFGTDCTWLLRLNDVDLVELWAAEARGRAALVDVSASADGVASLSRLNGDTTLRPAVGADVDISSAQGTTLAWQLGVNGAHQWSFQFSQGSAPADDRAALHGTPTGPLVFATFGGTSSVGNETINADAPSDVAFVKVDANGGLEYVKHFPGVGAQRSMALSAVQDDRSWALFSNGGTVDIGFGEFADDNGSSEPQLILTKLVP